MESLRILLPIVLCFALSACSATHQDSATPKQAAYSSWGIDEYELFGLSKKELMTKFKAQGGVFRENDTRLCIEPQKGLCAGYDGPTFDLTYDDVGRITRVQRVFLGCKETQWGPVLSSKREALQYFVSSMDNIAKNGSLRPDEIAKLKSARSELAGSAS